MRRIFWCCFAALALLVICALSRAAAQTQDDLHPNAHGGIFQPAAPAAPAPGASDNPGKSTPNMAIFTAVVSAVVVLCIICVPSRKSESVASR
jgi:hypothetical protein